MKRTEELRAESGTVTYTDPLTSFFYQLLRDHMTAGDVEKIVSDIVQEAGKDVTFTNGWLAKYANNLADTLRNAETLNLKGSLTKIWQEETPVPEKPAVKKTVKDEIIDSDLSAVKALVDSADDEEGPDENVMASLEESKAALAGMLASGQLSTEEGDRIKGEIEDLLGNQGQAPTTTEPVAQEVIDEESSREQSDKIV
jgi:hypothetical protein